MHRVEVKALSINRAWQGRRFKTSECRAYENSVFYLLPKINVPKTGNLALHIIAGLSNRHADLSNTVKLFEDMLQKKYDFNDNRIYRMVLEKVIVKKGQEFISFDLSLA